MAQFDSSKNYYDILGAEQAASQSEIDRLYKRLASRHHPDRGGSEEQMKTINEAYSVLRDASTRRDYDAQRYKPEPAAFVRITTPTAQDVGLFGQALNAFLCLLLGLFLLVLVRSQWIWFLWPLAILAFLVIGFGVLLARAALRSFNESLSLSNPFRRFKFLQETLFWVAVALGAFGIYLVFNGV